MHSIIIKFSALMLLSLSFGCDVETNQCETQGDCFSNETCVKNECLTPTQIKEKDNNGVVIDNNGVDNNGVENNGIVISCDENGTLNVGEECENGMALTETCESLGYDSGTLKCTDCQFDTGSCTTEPSTCGDGDIDGLEACDGSEFAGKTCETQVGVGSTGTLSCSDNCVVNTANCTTVFTTISASSSFTCASNSQGRISCWGRDPDAGALQPLVGKYVQVSTGGDFSCGLKRGGEVVCWGSSFGSNTEPPTEKFEKGLSSSQVGSCVLRPDKTVACWGSSHFGKDFELDGKFSQVSSGGTHSCGVTVDGLIRCWKGSTENTTVPEADDNSTFIQVDAGYNKSCAVMSNNNIVCWERETGARIETPPGEYTQISMLFSHVCALGTDQKVTCWGTSNMEGENEPQADKFTEVSAGRYHSCGIKLNGEIKCWGRETLIEIP